MPVLKNSKHEIFAQAIFSGMTQADAMNKAGYMYISSQHNGGGVASRLAHNVTIRQRITELHERSAELAIRANVSKSRKQMDREERLERLSTIGREDIEGRYGPLREPNISAIRALNDMTGDNAPAKVDLTPGFEDLLSKLRPTRHQIEEGDDDSS